MCHETPLLVNQFKESSRNFLGENVMAQSKAINISDSDIELKMSCFATSWFFALKECIFQLVIPFSACRMRNNLISSLSFLLVKSVESNTDLTDSKISWICWQYSHISYGNDHIQLENLYLMQWYAIVEVSATCTWNEE